MATIKSKNKMRKIDKDISVEIQEGMSKAKNYNRLLFENIRQYLGKRVLEVGCSIGNMTEFIFEKKDTELVYGIDVVDEAITSIKKRFSDKKIFDAETLDIAKLDEKKFKQKDIDTIICINVLEHVKDDSGALERFNSILKKKGKLLLIVPAHKCLYGSVDVTDHHFRRYSKKELAKKVGKAGFKIKKLHQFNLTGILGWYLNGKILKKKTVDQKMLGFYDKILPFLLRIERTIGFLPGLSLICIAEKR